MQVQNFKYLKVANLAKAVWSGDYNESLIMNEQELSDLQLTNINIIPTNQNDISILSNKYVIYIPKYCDIITNIECDVPYKIISISEIYNIIFDSTKNNFQTINVLCAPFVDLIMIFDIKPKYIKSSSSFLQLDIRANLINRRNGFTDGIYTYKDGFILST